MAVETRYGYLKLTQSVAPEDEGHVWVKGSAIVALVSKDESTMLLLTHESGQRIFVTSSVEEILEAITASYREVTRK